MLMGCRNVSELEEMISYQEEAIQTQEEIILDLNERIVEFEQQQREAEQLVSDLEVEIEQLVQEEEDDELEMADWELYSQWRQAFVINDLTQNIEALAVEFLGESSIRTDITLDEPSILFNEPSNFFGGRGHVTANVWGSQVRTIFIFSYTLNYENRPETEADWQEVTIEWEVLAYVVQGGVRLPGERNPRHLTDLETVTIRIYDLASYWEFEQDPIYREEVVVGAELWETTLYFMPEIWDLWYEGRTLYVDLMPVESVGVGGFHDLNRMARLRDIFVSFPDVSEIRFLTGGRPGITFSGYGPPGGGTWIYDVEAGAWASVCDLFDDDPWVIESERERLCE